jgi:putative CocE/NonD family hydrolase
MTPLCCSRRSLALLVAVLMLFPLGTARAQSREDPVKLVRDRYVKHECSIPMRDGVQLFTAVYMPRDTSQKYPMLMLRTPYGVRPYGKDAYPGDLGPSRHFRDEGFIFVYQDVRGCYLSGGRFVNMTPHVADKKSDKDIDESTDTYDTIDWLVKNVPNHNGRVGLWGVSYPGFYAAAGMIDAHPALKAVSPQAPIADWYFDDFNHHGAFFLTHAFNFLSVFGTERPKPTAERGGRFNHGTPDGYQFFLDIGPLKNANAKYLKNKIAFWDEMASHPRYDDFWKAHNLLPHLKKVAPAVMTVGGWFDAEDLYGPLKMYHTLERENKGIFNVLVMGPWQHGGWMGGSGERLGNIHFGGPTGEYFRKNIQLAFFNHFLKDRGEHGLPEAYTFETGTNRWRRFDQWPPRGLEKKRLYVRAGGRLSFEAPEDEQGYDEYVSDPAKPVPFTEAITTVMTTEYMTDDQRFAARRPDVLAWQTDMLEEDLTLAGPLRADLRVSTSGTDADWVVKLIDVFPPDEKDPAGLPPGRHLGGYQMMVRSEVIRGRFRNSYEKPEPFVANEPAKVPLELLDVLHTFKKGHRVMIQVQSTWFPLVDRNPQKYVPNLFLAEEKDFIKATQRVYRSKKLPTSVRVGVLPPK